MPERNARRYYDRHDMSLDTYTSKLERREPSPCPKMEKKPGCTCRHCRGVCLCHRAGEVAGV